MQRPTVTPAPPRPPPRGPPPPPPPPQQPMQQSAQLPVTYKPSQIPPAPSAPHAASPAVMSPLPSKRDYSKPPETNSAARNMDGTSFQPQSVIESASSAVKQELIHHDTTAAEIVDGATEETKSSAHGVPTAAAASHTTGTDRKNDKHHNDIASRNNKHDSVSVKIPNVVDFSSCAPKTLLLQEQIAALANDLLLSQPELKAATAAKQRRQMEESNVIAARRKSATALKAAFPAESFADVSSRSDAFRMYERAVLVGDDNFALQQLQEQQDISDERNMNSAVNSLEMLLEGSEQLLSHQIEVAAAGIENVIPELQMRLNDYKKELGRSHDSRALLETAVVAHYNTMRAGFERMTQQVVAETVAHMRLLGRMREQCMRWHLQQLQQLFDDRSQDPHRQERKLDVFSAADAAFHTCCERTFEVLKDDRFFEEKEAGLRQLEAASAAVHHWKADIVDASEERMNHAQIGLEAYYLGFAEELCALLSDMREMLSRLCMYERKLQHLAKSIEIREHAIERRSRHQRADAMISMGRKTSVAMRNPRLLMGTRIKALAVTSGVPLQDVENLLLHLLF